jgi:hypothetical protein
LANVPGSSVVVGVLFDWCEPTCCFQVAGVTILGWVGCVDSRNSSN